MEQTPSASASAHVSGSTPSTGLSLSIPRARDLVSRNQSLIEQNAQDTTNVQKELIENAFAELKDGATSVEFTTEQPLTEDIATELTNMGYDYSYNYEYLRRSGSAPQRQCRVVIYAPGQHHVSDETRNLMNRMFSEFDGLFRAQRNWRPFGLLGW